MTYRFTEIKCSIFNYISYSIWKYFITLHFFFSTHNIAKYWIFHREDPYFSLVDCHSKRSKSDSRVRTARRREQQNQLFIRIGREKVLIIRSKYNLNTRSVPLPSPSPQSFSFYLQTPGHDRAVTLRHCLLLTVNNHLYFQLALLIRRRRHCRSLKKMYNLIQPLGK